MPFLVSAEMSQSKIDKIYTKSIMLDAKHNTFNVLPINSTEGYIWFLISPKYDYVNATKFEHKSVDVENSK
jgi:hypothetical protein